MCIYTVNFMMTNVCIISVDNRNSTKCSTKSKRSVMFALTEISAAFNNMWFCCIFLLYDFFPTGYTTGQIGNIKPKKLGTAINEGNKNKKAEDLFICFE